MTISIGTPQEVQQGIALRFKSRRLSLNLTQEGLAERSGVSWGSLKHFERTGLISLESLLKLALVLDCLVDFDNVCAADHSGLPVRSLDELLNETKTRRKGRIKWTKLANTLQYSPANLYLYFKDKAEIFDSLVADCFALLLMELPQPTGAKNEDAVALKRSWRTYVDFGLKHPNDYQLEFLVGPAKEARPHKQRAAYDRLVAKIRLCIAQERFRTTEAELTAQGLWASEVRGADDVSGDVGRAELGGRGADVGGVGAGRTARVAVPDDAGPSARAMVWRAVDSTGVDLGGTLDDAGGGVARLRAEPASDWNRVRAGGGILRAFTSTLPGGVLRIVAFARGRLFGGSIAARGLLGALGGGVPGRDGGDAGGDFVGVRECLERGAGAVDARDLNGVAGAFSPPLVTAGH